MKHYLLHVILMLFIAITPVYLYAENDTPIDVGLSISGARDCIAGGSSLCKPINCVDIYQALK